MHPRGTLHSTAVGINLAAMFPPTAHDAMVSMTPEEREWHDYCVAAFGSGGPSRTDDSPSSQDSPTFWESSGILAAVKKSLFDAVRTRAWRIAPPRQRPRTWQRGYRRCAREGHGRPRQANAPPASDDPLPAALRFGVERRTLIGGAR